MSKNDMEESKTEWLALTKAAQYLGVHPTTLRRWAYQGAIPTSLTHGGHRRFQRADLEAFATDRRRLKTVVGLEELWSRQAMWETRQRLVQVQAAGWLTPFTETDREQKRQMGRRLMGITLQYIAADHSEDGLLNEAQAIGRAHAENAIAAGVSLADALQILQFFRETLVEVSIGLPETLAVRPQASLKLLRRVNTVLNAVERGLAEQYEASLH